MTLEQALLTAIVTESSVVVLLFGIVIRGYKACEKERKMFLSELLRVYDHLPVDAPRRLKELVKQSEEEES